MTVSSLSLAGHDSELFSFLDRQYIDELVRHPQAKTELWTFGDTTGDEVLRSISSWNTSPMCWAWTDKPTVTVDSENAARRVWSNYRGLTTCKSLLQVEALTLIRHLFCQGYTCALNDRSWIVEPADRQLHRLRFIRHPEMTDDDFRASVWADMKASYFDWCLMALEDIDP